MFLYLCVYIHVYILNAAILYEIIMHSMRAIDCLTKTIVSDMENLTLRCWSKEFKRLLKQYKLLQLSLVASQILKSTPYC